MQSKMNESNYIKSIKMSNKRKYPINLWQLTMAVITGIVLLTNHFIAQAEMNSNSDATLMVQALQESEVEVETFFFQHNEKMTSTFSEGELLHIRSELEKTWQLDLIDVSKNKENKAKENNIMRYQGKKVEGEDTLQVAFIATRKSQEESTFSGHLIVQYVTKDVTNWNEKYTTFVGTLKSSDVEPTINISIQGSYDKVLSQVAREKYIENMFDNLNGEVLEGLRSESVVSLSGYTEDLKRKVASSTGTINLQIGAHVHSSKSNTIITIGNPVIVMEY
jgi:hypothetical protein